MAEDFLRKEVHSLSDYELSSELREISLSDQPLSDRSILVLQESSYRLLLHSPGHSVVDL
jgi:hypothetical protein